MAEKIKRGNGRTGNRTRRQAVNWLSAATDGRELRATSGKRSKYRESTVKGRKTRGQRVIVATSGKIYLMVESHSGYQW